MLKEVTIIKINLEDISLSHPVPIIVFNLFYGHTKTGSCDNVVPLTNETFVKERNQFLKF